MMRTESFGWHSWGDVARELTLGAVLGVVVAFIESGGTKELPDLETIVRNVIIGTCIMGVSRLLETLMSWAIEQSQFPIVFRSVLYAGGGWVGYFMGVGMTAFLFGEQDDVFSIRSYHFVYSMLATAIVSMLIGFVLHHNRKRNLRLRQSIERLKEHEFAEKELEIARAVQQRLLPPSRIERDGFRLTARTEAAHMVGGDFYEVVELSGGLVGIVVADVSGKGIAASLIMASCKAVIPFLASGKTAEEVMAALNDKLCRELESREFVALVYLQFNTLSGQASIVNAGMPEPLLIQDRSSEPLSFEGPRLPLGLRPELAYRATSVALDVGAKLVFYSDGLPEAMAGDEALGYDRVNQLVREAARQGDGSGTVDSVFVAIRAIPSLQILDDLTVVMLERRGHQSS